MLFKIILKITQLKSLHQKDQKVLTDLNELKNKSNRNFSMRSRLIMEIKRFQYLKTKNRLNRRKLINLVLKNLNINRSNLKHLKYEIFKMHETNISIIQMLKSLQLLSKTSLMSTPKRTSNHCTRETPCKKRFNGE